MGCLLQASIEERVSFSYLAFNMGCWRLQGQKQQRKHPLQPVGHDSFHTTVQPPRALRAKAWTGKCARQLSRTVMYPPHLVATLQGGAWTLTGRHWTRLPTAVLAALMLGGMRREAAPFWGRSSGASSARPTPSSSPGEELGDREFKAHRLIQLDAGARTHAPGLL